MTEDSDEEEETDSIVNQVLDEIGISLTKQLVDAPEKNIEHTEEKIPVLEGADQDLQSRLENLRRN